MRRVLGLAAAVALAALSVQPLDAQDLTLGLKGGAAVTDLKVEEGAFGLDMDSRTRFTGGAFLTIDLGPVLALQPEMLWVPKGAEVELQNVVAGFDFTYLELPVLLVGRLPVRESQVRPFLLGGGALSFETRCRISTTQGALTWRADCDDPDVLLERRETDLGLVLGGGVELDARGAALIFDLRYNHGLRDVDRRPEGTIKNRAISFLAGVGLRLR